MGRTVPFTDPAETRTESISTDDSFVIENMTISGFDGLSGSMIGHFSDDDPAKPGVIGICKPLPYDLHNRLLLY